ncbi:hypothetical protein ABZ136_29225, partial [Streptomyces microflavus]|uniref:hypothetical protein n=1 Tax=Streptomyces microflavus TaxID=1919 RepID=UPI0033B71DC7
MGAEREEGAFGVADHRFGPVVRGARRRGDLAARLPRGLGGRCQVDASTSSRSRRFSRRNAA